MREMSSRSLRPLCSDLVSENEKWDRWRRPKKNIREKKKGTKGPRTSFQEKKRESMGIIIFFILLFIPVAVHQVSELGNVNYISSHLHLGLSLSSRTSRRRTA